MNAPYILSIEDLHTQFVTGKRVIKAVDGVSLNVRRGKTLGLVGESGCGKSVTAHSIMRLLPNAGSITRGKILFRPSGGVETDLAAHKKNSPLLRSLRGKSISMIFQDPMASLNPVYRVGDQIVENIRAHERIPAAEAWERGAKILETLSIPRARERMKDYPHQFSGGMKQRVMIAMGLICGPELLIADEPTTALDVTIQAQILELIRELRQSLGFTVILITHNMGIVADLADDIAVMYMGKIVEYGTKEDIFLNAAHPYTRALLNSVPVLGNQGKKFLEPIRGNTPDPSEMPKGCAFAPRCDFCRAECSGPPPEVEREPRRVASGLSGHRVRCFLYRGEGSILSQEPEGAEKAAGIPAPREPEETGLPPGQREPARILLEMKNIKKYFPITQGFFRKTAGWIRAVDGVTLFVRQGETLGLVGESGCGKTTLGKCVVRLQYPGFGEMRYNFGGTGKGDDGFRNLLSLNKEERFRARRKIQMVFQDPYSSLNPVKTIFTAFDEPLRIHGWTNAAERKEKIVQSLERVNLRPEHLYRYPHEFSGGQRQRICIARSLCVEPELVVCDEPVSALDVSIQAQVLNLMKELQRGLNLTYIFIAHDLSVVEYMSDRIAVMYLGVIVELAPADALYNRPRHPYTEALLSAIPVPRLADRRERIILEGDVPSPADPPRGCRFHTRCRKRKERCRIETPELRPLAEAPDHLVACFEEAAL